MRPWALCCLLLALPGCNMVTTTDPLFTKADEAGAPKLKPGVWAPPKTADCAFDERMAVDTWPACANGMVVGQGTLGGYDKKDGASTLTKTGYILAGGQPLIVQVHDIPVSGTGLDVAGYFYASVRAAKTDDQGRVIAFTAWPVLCGPPPPASASKPGNPVYGTLQPLPGLVMDKDKGDCTTDKVDALRAAATASEQWEADNISNLHWVRDGDR